MNDLQENVEVVDPNNLSDDELVQQFECFGSMFQKSDGQCMNDCFVRDRCVTRMGTKTIPEIMRSYGGKASVEQVAEELGSDVESVTSVVKITKKQTTIEEELGLSKTAKAQQEPVVLEEPEPEEESEEEAPEEEAAEAALEPPKKKAKKKAPAKKKAAKKKAAKKAPLAKKKVKEKAVAAVKKKATKKKAAGKKAPKKKAPTGDPAVFGSEAFAHAFTRERGRSELVGLLQPGQKISRDYKGESYTVTVKSDHYLYNNKKFPTLYSILLVITGEHEYARKLGDKTRKMSNWSAPRFFRLEKA